jgi:translation initiation factor 2 beta subunit (eIF-2beta)/eIF-5
MLMSFISAALGTSVNFNVIRGKHDLSVLGAKLSVFIDDYVLCSDCTNPETYLTLNTAGTKIKVTCKACGAKYKKEQCHDIIIKALRKEQVKTTVKQK